MADDSRVHLQILLEEAIHCNALANTAKDLAKKQFQQNMLTINAEFTNKQIELHSAERAVSNARSRLEEYDKVEY
jgi:hypothetical protein